MQLVLKDAEIQRILSDTADVKTLKSQLYSDFTQKRYQCSDFENFSEQMRQKDAEIAALKTQLKAASELVSTSSGGGGVVPHNHTRGGGGDSTKSQETA